MLWGVAAALLANLLFSTGFVVEKRALSALPPLSAARPARVVLALLRSPLWIVGAAALLLGFAAQLVVYRTLPLVAAQGLFVTGLVMLLLLSALFLGEQPSGRERRGMAAVLAALVMIVLSLPGSEGEIARIAPAPVLLGVCVPSLVLGLGLFLAAERRARRRHRLPTAGVPYGVAVGFLYGVSSLAIKGVAGLLTPDATATLGALLTSPYPYLLVCTGSTGLVLSQTALQRCRASLIVPVCTTVTFLFTVVSGSFAFAEPLPAEPLRLALRLGGAALAVTVLLSLPRHDTAAQDAGPQRTTAQADAPPHATSDADSPPHVTSGADALPHAGAHATDPQTGGRDPGTPHTADPHTPGAPAAPRLPSAGRTLAAAGPGRAPEPPGHATGPLRARTRTEGRRHVPR